MFLRNAGILLLVFFPSSTSNARAQPFQDLDFESATFVTAVGGTVNFGPAFPGWSGYAGTNQLGTVQYDLTFLDTTGISILDANTPPFGVFGELIDGNYTAVLQAGNDFGLTPTDVSLSQTGLVPPGTKSLSFYARLNSSSASDLIVSLGGVNLNLISSPVADTDFAFYQANVSAFAGLQKELKFTLLAQNPHVDNRYLSLDDIEFSPTAIPEPSGLSLVMMALVSLSLWRFTSCKVE